MHELLEKATEMQETSIKIRKEIHAYPELPFQEFRTAELIKRELEAEGIQWYSVGDTGVIAVVEGTKKSERIHTIALRADMDALEITEETGVSFASTRKGIMHACGHDIHTTSLLMTCKLLNSIRDTFSGRVLCIFQPAEELVSGAEYMMDKNNFMQDVEAIIGFHVNPKYPVGSMAFRDGGLLFAGEMFKITIEGKGGHGSRPNTGIDALLAASAVVLNSQAIISRETDPRESAVITICTMEAGTRHNIIAAKAEMKGTIRCYSEEKRWELRKALERIVENTAETFGAKGKVEWSMYVPPVINDAEVGMVAKKAAADILGQDNVLEAEPDTSSDDFAYYLKNVPGYYIYVGCSKPGEEVYSLHHPKFLPDESCIPYFVASSTGIAIDLLRKKGGE